LCMPDTYNNRIYLSGMLFEMGKAPASIRDAMKDDFDECVTAHVLLNWCKVGKTQVGRLLSPKEFGDDKSYRNHVDKLLLRAARLSIRQE